MNLICPSCASSYAVADDVIGEQGRKVRCPSCGHVWHAMRPNDVDAQGLTSPDSLAEPDTQSFQSEAQPGVAQARTETDAEGGESVERFSQTLWNNIREMRDDDEHNKDDDAFDTFSSADVEAFEDSEIATNTPDGKPSRRRIVRLKNKKKAPSVSLLPVLKQSTPAFVAAGLIILAMLYPQRDMFVRAFPDLAGLFSVAGIDVNVHGIEISSFVAVREMVAGLPVMRIEGELLNVSPAQRDIPALRVALIDEMGEELIAWSHEPVLASLSEDETLMVRTDLSSPPPNAASVVVRFFNEGEELPGVAR